MHVPWIIHEYARDELNFDHLIKDSTVNFDMDFRIMLEANSYRKTSFDTGTGTCTGTLGSADPYPQGPCISATATLRRRDDGYYISCISIWGTVF